MPVQVHPGQFGDHGRGGRALVGVGVVHARRIYVVLEWPNGKRLAIHVAMMRRSEVRDPVYNLNGAAIPGVDDGRSIGALWALSGSLRLTPQWTVNATAAHLVAGDCFGPFRRDIHAAFVDLHCSN